MTVLNETRLVEYTGNGTLATYSYPFKVFEASHLKVTRFVSATAPSGLVLTQGADYTYTGIGADAGGTVTLTAGNLPTGYVLRIEREMPYTQDADLTSQGTFYPQTHEDALDALEMQIQQVKDLTEPTTTPDNLFPYNVELYGALGDGVTDDTAAIQAAINACYTAGGGIVWFGSGTYLASQIVLKQGISLRGQGMNPSPHGLGTTLQQKGSTNLDFIVTDTALGATEYQHWSTVENMRLLGHATNTVGSGIRLTSRSGEGFKLEHLHVASFAESGVEATNGCIPFYCEDLHLFNNGLYGIDISRGGGDLNQLVALNLISGDDNATALIRINTSGGAGETYSITGVKAEKKTPGKQNNAIILNNLNGSPVFVADVCARNNSGEAANAAVRIATSSARLSWHAVTTDANYTYTIEDTVNGPTYSGTNSAHGATHFNVGTTLIASRLGPASAAASGGAIRIVDGVKFAASGAGIAAAISDLPSSGGTVFVPAGSYSLSSNINLASKTNINIVLDNEAILTANAAINMFNISGNSSYITIRGGCLDGNSTAVKAILVDAVNIGEYISNITIDNVEIKNVDGDGVYLGANNYTYAISKVIVRGCRIHDLAKTGIALRPVVDCKLIGNVIWNYGSGAVAAQGISIGDSIGTVVQGNHITAGYAGPGGNYHSGISSYSGWNAVVSGNVLDGGNYASHIGMWFDTTFGFSVTGNVVRRFNAWGIYPEVSGHISISGNTVEECGYGIYLGGRHDEHNQVISACDSTTGFTAGGNVTLTADSGDKQEGSASLKSAIASGFTTGTVFYYDYGSSQMWQYWNTIRFWIKHDSGTWSRGLFQIVLAKDTALATPLITIDLPYFPGSIWHKVEIPMTGCYRAIGSSGVKSWGLKATADPGTINVWLDDVRLCTYDANCSITGNTIRACSYNGIQVLTKYDNFNISGNSITDADWQNSSAQGSGHHGILIDASEDFASGIIKRGIIANNSIRFQRRSVAGYQYGIRVNKAASASVRDLMICNNDVQGVDSSQNPISIASACIPYITVKDNLTIWGTGLTGGSVASAATITLPVAGDYFTISGTTNITNISASWPGRRVTLKFDGVLTVNSGGNLKVNGSFTTTADDTITFIGDGTNWFETSRSANA